MRAGRMILAAASVALASTPIAAQAVAAERAAAPVAGENAMGGGAVAPIFALLAFVVFLVASSGEDEPASP
jgi:hypothetical protein